MKTEKFNNLIFETYGQNKNFDMIAHNLKRIRKIMESSHETFKLFSAKKQFDFCITIGIIVVQSTTYEIRNLGIIKKSENEILEYSVNEYYKEPKIIEINKQIQP